ncbi:MAG: tetratricopeptide repeat protein [Candidatus Dadabacteria bacterium]|nr:tetratricopeptide repeat protein [Candidatus Dadabacteria bacterium]
MGILDPVLNKKKDDKANETAKTKPVEDADSLFKSGKELYNTGDYLKAELEFRRALSLNPNLKDARYYLGKIYESRIERDDDFETMEEAMNEYQEVLKIDPSFISAHISLGGLYIKSGFYEGAIRELEEALRINPNSPEAHAAMGEALYTIGSGREVKVEHPSGMGATSDFRGAKEYFKKAIDEFNHAIRLEPSLAQRLQPIIEKASQRVK